MFRHAARESAWAEMMQTDGVGGEEVQPFHGADDLVRSFDAQPIQSTTRTSMEHTESSRRQGLRGRGSVKILARVACACRWVWH